MQSGFTLVEIMVTFTVLLVAGLGAMGSISTFGVLASANSESTLARGAAQAVLEQLSAQEFSEVFRRYNADPTDDPAWGSSPGSAFDVPGLTAREDDPDGRVGEILFAVTAINPGELREDYVDPGLGFPRDLNGDRLQDGLNHAGDYLLLPVRVRVRWRGRAGNRQVEVQTTLRPK